MASTYLTRTSSSATNVNKYTFSAWIKRSLLTSSFQPIFGGTGSTLANYHDSLFFSNSTDKFIYQGATSGSTEVNLQTSASYRDVSAWYHVVVAYDSTQSTASNRVKIYINGVQETSFSTATYPAQNRGAYANGRDSSTITISKIQNDAVYFNGSMSHIHFIDGTAYDASYFGSTDSVTGEWKINTSPSVTYGTNGFFILKDGNSVTDQSGEGNDFTVSGGTLTKTEDNPSNVFATWNPLAQTTTKGTLSNGNLTYDRAGSSDNWVTVFGTEAFTQGKYYYEYKIIDGGSSAGNGSIVGLINYDISDIQNKSLTHIGGNSGDGGMGWYGAGNLFTSSGDQGIFSNYTDGDIVMIAVDADNGYVYWGKNNSWINSGDPTSGSTGTGGFVLSLAGSNGTYCFGVSHREGGNGTANFGNGYFGTTAVSSAGTNASGNGIFEYDVPTGFTALSTKGLNL